MVAENHELTYCTRVKNLLITHVYILSLTISNCLKISKLNILFSANRNIMYNNNILKFYKIYFENKNFVIYLKHANSDITRKQLK